MSEVTKDFKDLLDVKFDAINEKIDSHAKLVNDALISFNRVYDRMDVKVTDIEKAIAQLTVESAKHYKDCPNTRVCQELLLSRKDDKIDELQRHNTIDFFTRNPKVFVIVVIAIVAWAGLVLYEVIK